MLGLLRGDFAALEAVRIDTSNAVPRAAGKQSVVGAYVHGEAHLDPGAGNARAVAFGGVLVLSFTAVEEHLRIRSIRFQLNWVQGDVGLLTGWQLPVMDRLWQPGDAPAVVVSELDAPWHQIPASDLPTSDNDAIAEAWFRYAWGLDQADFSLFEQAFSEDVEAELTPMGRPKGRRTLMATLKAFRMPWPWMKHYEPPRVGRSCDPSC
ncbi:MULTISPECIES: nuclear transport factor 2 family protein [Pigmentiphaga]|uniref:SnoaL-like domain-containing protein n=1 Tax=Pigmentiphaga daeguensis TaxID=414049 RepID=A0ABP3N5Y0_9BURK|nr:nuclear transport factor 2 family protein [Pigmentiphaga sp. NML030171]